LNNYITMVRSRNALLALALTLAAAEAPAQTVTWGGGFPNSNFSAATNWIGGAVPPGYTAGTDTVVFDDNSDSYMKLDVAGVSLFQLQVTDPESDGNYAKIFGANSLTLGSGGILLSSSDSVSSLDLNVAVSLAAAQTWSGGYVSANNVVSGSGPLTVSGGNWLTFSFNSGSNSFSGGLTASGLTTTVSLGAAGTPLGTGPVTMGDGTILEPATSTPITLANAFTFGDGTNGNPVVVGSNYNNFYLMPSSLTLTGPVTLVINGDSPMDSEIDLAPLTTLTLTGTIAGAVPGVCLDFGTTSTGNVLAIVKSPSITNVDRIDLEDNAAVIFDGGISQLSNLGYSIGTTSTTYLGLGASYVNQVANFISTYANPGGFSGTLGFDNTTGGTTTFTDNIDLTNFTSGSFVGLGSETSAVLTGTITPPGGTNGLTYYFGGGGGTLYVQSSLVDGTNSRGVNLAPGNAPLTLVLQGSLNYSGNTSVVGGALIFDTALPIGGLTLGSGSSNPGYIGVTPNAGFTDANSNIQSFINHFNDTGGSGVIGFDSLSGPQTITSAIDLSGVGPFVYLGTETNVTYSGVITPNGSTYRFAGVKGGQVTVSSPLTGANSVVVGLDFPIETYSQSTGAETVSSVTLSGANSYSGNTTLYSGILNVTNASSLGGTGTLVVPGSEVTNSDWAATLATSGAAVTLNNPIQIPEQGLALNTGSTYTLTLNGTISAYSSYGNLGIFGPVVINGSNTYSGETQVANATVTVNSNTGFGASYVSASGSTINFTSAAPVLNGLDMDSSTVSFAGSPTILDLQMAQSTLNFAASTTPSITGFSSDSPNSGNTISIGSGATLTINVEEDPDYHGVITGSGNLVIATGNLNFSGNSTGYSGTTTIGTSATVAASNNNAFGTGPVVVSGVLATNTGVTMSNPITLNDGGTLAGYGTYSPPSSTITFQNGSKLVPGVVLFNVGSSSIPAIATLSFGANASLAFGPAGNMAFSLMDGNGTAGVGYSSVNAAGSLNITATPGTPFDIYLFSYAPGTNAPEATQAANFNPAQSYSWTLISAAGGITNFNASDFSVLTSYNSSTTFLNPTGVGMFYVTESGNSLLLNFTPVPEPSTWALMASGLFAAGAALRRRRR
jgi:autotransporter-associated beta strand protein